MILPKSGNPLVKFNLQIHHPERHAWKYEPLESIFVLHNSPLLDSLLFHPNEKIVNCCSILSGVCENTW